MEIFSCATWPVLTRSACKVLIYIYIDKQVNKNEENVLVNTPNYVRFIPEVT